MIDCCSQPGLMPFEDALENMLAAITPIQDIEEVNVVDAYNYVLAEDILSPLNVPPHHNSAMDGYAFAIDSLGQSKTLTMVGRSMAGEPFTGECLPGQCIRIMTGAKLPACCDSVEMQENCQVDGDQITFLEEKAQGSHVRNAGEDIKLGDAVFNKGHRLTAIDVGVLASLGIEKIQVMRKLNIALIATGDELKKPGQVLLEGDIYESNSTVLAGILQKLNVNIIDFGIIEDDFEAIKAAFVQADEQADIVISSGGVSVGDADYTKMVLDELGEIGFWKIAMKPGKPFAFGTLPNSIFFGLPGNPVSALVTFHQVGLAGLLKLQNAKPLQRAEVKVKTTTDLKKSPGRMDFQRGVLAVNDNGETVVTSTGSQGSGILSSLSKANCFIVLPSCQGKVKAGELVTVQLFDQYLN